MSQNDPASTLGVHEVHMNHDNPSFHHRKQIVQYAMQMNPKNVGGKDGGSASAGESMSASSASPYRRFENNENSA